MRILRLLRESPLSRADLARKTGLTRAAISGIADELIKEGLLTEGERVKTVNGRRPIMLELSPEAFYTVGIDISRNGVRLCILDFTMGIISEKYWSVGIKREIVLREIIESVRVYGERYHLLGIGVVAPGPIDCIGGRILEPHGLDEWHGFCIRELEDELSLPVVIKRDTSALAIAEKSRIGLNSSFLILLADHGIGGGYVYRGRLFESDSGAGCELGHISICADGPLCSCGNRGCAEGVASIPATLNAARDRDFNANWYELVSLAESGNSTAIEILSVQASHLASVCVSAINILEPSCIVFEGELCRAYSFMRDILEKQIKARCFTQNGRDVAILNSALPKNARAFSAANLILDKFFDGDNYDNFGTV